MTTSFDSLNIPDAEKKDIIELENKIQRFRSGQIDEERFKLYRLTRGVYGQRQLGVQMFRIKIPYGSLTSNQLYSIADISDKYASSNLHLTTRQDIQLHYVRLDDSPKVWIELTQAGLTGREACGNTVRNLTASANAGIDPDEPFDITPYAHAVAYYFLRNPICQEMGRKIKPSFSSSDKDSAFSFFHDFGFIPKIKNIDGAEVRGFKIVVGGGLGAQAITAQTAHEFIPTDQIIPFMEAGLRVFDRHGEREKRHKARLKFLIKKIGIDGFLTLVEEERKALKYQSYPIDESQYSQPSQAKYFKPEITNIANWEKYDQWKKTNTFEQKQKGYFGVYLKVQLGDISSDDARLLAPIIKKYTSDEMRITVNQGLLLKFVHEDHLPELFTQLEEIGYASPGFDSIGDVTACPGTDTCNLGVTNSTGLAKEIENLIQTEYPELLSETHIKIKISGCMNACGQHMAANIGFSGSSIKKNELVVPAMQVVIGGGLSPDGKGWIAEKVIKLPTKKILEALRLILDHFEENGEEGEYFNDYFVRYGKKAFYNLLKPLADIQQLSPVELFDWGQDHKYQQEIGVGECAGVILDVVGTIIDDAKEKLHNAENEFQSGRYAESIYYAYASYVVAAKAILLSHDIKCNTQANIIRDFQEHIVGSGEFKFDGNFADHVLLINQYEPNKSFSTDYLNTAYDFIQDVIAYRENIIATSGADTPVVESYYKA